MPLDNPDMSVIEATSLWKRTLAPNLNATNSPLEKQKEHLRTIFFAMRARVASLVQDISKDLAEFTIHDVTHLDALWEMADLILGDAYEVTPVETFIFGGAVLLHDAGLTLSAYPGGWDDIKAMPEWNDGVVIECRRRGMSDIPASIIENPPEDIRYNVLQSILRENHARQATVLASAKWKVRDIEYHLIEDQDAREDVGRLIGEIATSHWWSLPEVEQRFSRDRNAPAWCRHAGKIRPLVVACLLRCADAIHLDARRAPRFNRARLRLSERSALHWDFQERLDAPSRVDDSIYFTGGTFSEADFAAWWLCHELLTMANSELEGCHALLSDKRYAPFAARRIHSQNDVARLSELIKTEGWTPVDAPVRISNVAGVVRELGGTALYHGNRWVVIRELIQNAADAIRARRVLEHRKDDWGTITITLSSDGRKLTCADTGIGMSQFVIRNYLLDFFSSFWTSNSVQKAFKGRMQQLNPTGKFGIGFFSVFMVAREVKVITRTVLGESSSTLVLEFPDGYNDRPVLRYADEKERLVDPGTSIELTFFDEFGLVELCTNTSAKTLTELVGYAAPTLDVDVRVSEDGEERVVVQANDWLTLDGLVLLNRIAPNYAEEDPVYNSTSRSSAIQECAQRLSGCLRSFERSGVPMGRLAVQPQSIRYVHQGEFYVMFNPPALGVITSGGLRTGPLRGFAGCIEGEVLDASRSRGLSRFTETELRQWAVEHEKAVDTHLGADTSSDIVDLDEMLMEFATVICYLYGELPRELPVCLSASKERLRLTDLATRFQSDEIYVLSGFPTRPVAKADLTREQLLERIRHDETVFDLVSVAVPDNVVVVPVFFDMDEYAGIMSSMTFTTGSFQQLSRDVVKAEREDSRRALLHQIMNAAKALWGEVACDLSGWDSDDSEKIDIPTKDGGVFSEHCAVFRRVKPSNM